MVSSDGAVTYRAQNVSDLHLARFKHAAGLTKMVARDNGNTTKARQNWKKSANMIVTAMILVEIYS